MDIKPVATNLITDLGTNRPETNKQTESTNSTGSSSATAPDLSLTSTAKNLLDVQTSMQQIADVDLGKVEAIRQAIEDGSYEIDSAKLADNLIKSGLELP